MGSHLTFDFDILHLSLVRKVIFCPRSPLDPLKGKSTRIEFQCITRAAVPPLGGQGAVKHFSE